MMKKVACLVGLFCVLASAPAYAVDVEEVTAPKSGVTAWLVEDHKLPVLSMRFAWRGGSEQDPVAKQGLASLTMDALAEGAGPYDAAQFQHELANHSISLGFEAGRDMVDGGLKCLSADKAKAFSLLHLALTDPHFAKKDIERLRARQLAGIRQEIGDPGWQARYALFSEIFADHPYGERHLGSTQTLAAITLPDIRAFAHQHLARDNLIVTVAGDITPTALASALDKVFGGLPGHAQLRPIPDIDVPGGLPPELVRRAGTQTEFLFAMPGPKRDNPDWYAAEIANYILGGGGFSSRLMHEVRVERGLTYGIATALAPSDHNGMIVGQAAVDNPKAGAALETIRATMERFYDGGATIKEIAAAKDYLTGS
ncbi:MAG: insulinase family protein, partial [Alphaproteobacteria bacterium]|nr:insulinase family protein [Alphaproteobacteria bacterium]